MNNQTSNGDAYNDKLPQEIDGSLIAEEWRDDNMDLRAVTQDGRHWKWYYESDTGYGEWREA